MNQEASSPPVISTGFQFAPVWTFFEDGLDISSGFDRLQDSAMGPDGQTLWISTSSPITNDPDMGVFMVDLQRTSGKKIWSGNAGSLAALSNEQVYFLNTDNYEINLIDQAGQSQKIAALPGGQVPTQISAAPDVGLFALSQSGNLFLMAPNASDWTSFDSSIGISRISVGGMDSIYAISNQILFQYNTGNGWQKFPTQPFTSGQLYWISASQDGSIWAQESMIGTGISLYPTGGPSWFKPFEMDGIIELIGSAAGSMSSFFSVRVGGTFTGAARFQTGLNQLPAFPWPAFENNAQSEAFTFISSSLGVFSGNIRAQYTDQTEPFSIWFTELTELKAPSNIDATDFGVVKQQILTELKYVVVINELFKNLDDLNQNLGIVNSDNLQSVAQFVGLENNPTDDKAIINAIFGALFQGIVKMVIGAFPAPVSKVLSLVLAGLNAGLKAQTGQQHPPNFKLEIAYGKLAKFMANLFLDSGSAFGEFQKEVLSDWRRMELLGAGLVSGQLSWPDGKSIDIAKKAAPAYVSFFYGTLMPVKWKLVEVQNWLVPLSVNVPSPGALPDIIPAYNRTSDCLVNESETAELCTVRFFQRLDACSNPFTCSRKSFEHYPAQTLIDELLDLNISRDDLFQNKMGWDLKQVLINPADN